MTDLKAKITITVKVSRNRMENEYHEPSPVSDFKDFYPEELSASYIAKEISTSLLSFSFPEPYLRSIPLHLNTCMSVFIAHELMLYKTIEPRKKIYKIETTFQTDTLIYTIIKATMSWE